jgi:hypothetical protein
MWMASRFRDLDMKTNISNNYDIQCRNLSQPTRQDAMARMEDGRVWIELLY